MKRILAGCLVALAIGGGAAAAGDGQSVLRASPKRVNFGTKLVGTFTVKGSTITNTSSSDLLVQTSAVRMPDQFSWGLLPGQTCPIFSPEILVAGESCGIVAGFRPEDFFVGLEDRAVLALTATDPATGSVIETVAVEFRGTGKISP